MIVRRAKWYWRAWKVIKKAWPYVRDWWLKK